MALGEGAGAPGPLRGKNSFGDFPQWTRLSTHDQNADSVRPVIRGKKNAAGELLPISAGLYSTQSQGRYQHIDDVIIPELICGHFHIFGNPTTYIGFGWRALECGWSKLCKSRFRSREKIGH
jgi:hypothetical protein